MNYRSVLFDLYGTLVGEFLGDDWDRLLGEMAEQLGVPRGEFRNQWGATAIERQTGRMGSVEDNLRAICERLGRMPSKERIARAMALRMDMYARYFRPRPGAEETLRETKQRGYSVALISMCAPDTPPLWRASPLARHVDVEVFSCEVGLRKPDPEIYLHATERLGVEPADCLYVGDGAYGELTGAAGLGMHAVLIRDPREIGGTMLRPEAESWDGHAVADLREVLTLL